MIQIGIFGEPDEPAAWNLVQQELSKRLVWSLPFNGRDMRPRLSLITPEGEPK